MKNFASKFCLINRRKAAELMEQALMYPEWLDLLKTFCILLDMDACPIKYSIHFIPKAC